MAGFWGRLGPAFDAFRRTLTGECANPGCMGNQQLEQLLLSAPVVLYVLRWGDLAPVFISANLTRFTGLTPEQLINDPARRIIAIHPDDRDRYNKTLATLAEHGRLALDYRVRHAEGGWRWVRDAARVVLDAQGQPVEVVGSWQDISDRRASEVALAASAAQLRNAQTLLTDALESSGDAFSLYDSEDRLVVFNARYKEFYTTITEIIRPGIRFQDLIRLSAQRGQYMGVSPDQAERWVAERMIHHRSATEVFEQQLSDGRFLEIVERPTSDGGRVAIRRDVTARKRVEAALRQELAFKQALIDALPFPVFFKGLDGRYIGCNTRFAEVTGRDMADIVGHTIHDVLPAPQAEDFARDDSEMFRNPGQQTREATLPWGDGSFRSVQVVKGPLLDSDGKVAGCIGSLIDITPQKRAEEQLVQAAKLATLGQIASEVAHELNQPLTIIRMSAERCLQDGETMPPEDLWRKMGTIVAQVGRMAEIVNHLRSFSRVETGPSRSFAPGPVVAAAARLLSPQFQLDGITLEIRVDDDCPEIVGQANQLEQVVLNLLGNARDAVRKRCSPGNGRVEIGASREGADVIIWVHDNGGGVPDAMWPLVFDPFFTTKSDGAGTGLGLSISTNIAAGMGGTLTGANLNGGACFTLTLPAAAPNESARPEPPRCEPAPPPESAATPPRGRILVVDDEALSAECIVEYLRLRGLDAQSAISPDEALAAARATPFDLVISDLRLPGMLGTALLARLRAEMGDVPTILMTGGPLPSAAEAEGAEVIGKPLVLADLLARCLRLLAAHRQECTV